MKEAPSVTVLIPALNEERHISGCLASVLAQTYDGIVEILVMDGGSSDRTCAVAAEFPKVRIIENPRRIQSAALNRGLQEARGDVVVRVDAHCVLNNDYVERAVDALERTGAGMVGGTMDPAGQSPMQRAVARAMSSRFGAGPARFHVGGESGWVDTVYLGAFRKDLLLEIGGWAEDVGVNEDAELAYRVSRKSGVWYEPTMHASYVPRDSLRAVAKQFYRYGRSRATTVRKHPQSLSGRQLVAPALVVGLVSPWRRLVCTLYAGLLAALTLQSATRDGLKAEALFATVLPVMHCSWGVGFFAGHVAGPPKAARPPQRFVSDDPDHIVADRRPTPR